jgi:hypothetical protein
MQAFAPSKDNRRYTTRIVDENGNLADGNPLDNPVRTYRWASSSPAARSPPATAGW